MMVVPMVAFATLPNFLASPPWLIIPRGKKIRVPKSDNKSPGVVPWSVLFNSCAKGFNMVKYIIAILCTSQL